MSNFYGWLNKETGAFKKKYGCGKTCVFLTEANAQEQLEHARLTDAYQVEIIRRVGK